MKKFLGKCGIFVIAIIILIPLLNYALWDNVHSYMRISFQEMYEHEGNIDVLFLGSSHAYRSFDPGLAEEIMGVNCFNAGSSAQGMCDSYYLLKEICQNHEVKTVYLDVYYSLMQASEGNKTATYIVADYIKNPINRIRLLVESLGIEGLPDGILKFRQDMELDCSSLIKTKLSDAYREGSYEFITYTNQEYRGDGFVYAYYSADEDLDYTPDTHATSEPTEFWIKYLEKIISFCKSNNIELVLLETPMPDAMLENVSDYEGYLEFMSNFATSNNIEFWDFNLATEALLTMNMDEFADNDHLNGKGAEKFTKIFCEWVINYQNGVVAYKDMFYETYQQKLLYNRDNTPITQ